MAKDKITEYDATAANNTVVGDVNLAENSALPSDMNNAVRELMSHQKEAFGSGTPLYVDQTNNRVGITNASPSAKLDLGAEVGGSAVDVTKHISLFGATYGFGITSNTINYITGGDTHAFRVSDGTELARIDTHGIKFNGDTAAANALDDYEEGIWTPAFEMVSGSASFSYQVNGQKGYYTKVGRQVSILFSIHSAGATVTTDGPVRISGLPFTSANLSNGRSYSLGFKQLLDANEVGLLLAINNDDSKIELFEGHQNYPESHRHIDASMLENDRRIRGTMTYFV